MKHLLIVCVLLGLCTSCATKTPETILVFESEIISIYWSGKNTLSTIDSLLVNQIGHVLTGELYAPDTSIALSEFLIQYSDLRIEEIEKITQERGY